MDKNPQLEMHWDGRLVRSAAIRILGALLLIVLLSVGGISLAFSHAGSMGRVIGILLIAAATGGCIYLYKK